MKTLKKNQIVVFVIGLMVIAAGYLNFTNTERNNALETSSQTQKANTLEIAGIGDAKLVSANTAESNTIESNNSIAGAEKVIEEENENNNEKEADNETSVAENTIGTDTQIIDTNAETISTDEYFTTSRLERNTMYSQQIENYQEILSNTNVSDTQKKIAQEEITRINKEQNAIMIAENLIKTKGIEDLVIFVNEESINVIVKGDALEKEEIAQIQNIVTRELEANIENVHIMNK